MAVIKGQAPPQSLSGGAHYHAIKATKNWDTYVKGIQSTVTKTAEARARINRETEQEARRDEANHTSP